jgi:hypothetical protein
MRTQNQRRLHHSVVTTGLSIAATTLLALSLLTAHLATANEITPNKHFRFENPLSTDAAGAERLYQSLVDRMRTGYALADYPAAKYYLQWQRFNKAPYLSEGHGNRYLNNYGNRTASNYLSLQAGEKMSVGAILAKDSFTAKQDGTALPGSLFLMEKLKAGARREYGDWRYIMVLPDGAVLGDSEGANEQAMQFCHGCHTAAHATDYLFLLPADNQLTE